IEQQARLLMDHWLPAIRSKASTHIRRAAILPHDRPMDRLSGRPVPNNNRLTLIRNSNGCQIGPLHARLGERLAGHISLARPNLFGVVLDPPGLRKMLFELALRQCDNFAAAIKNDGPRRRGALIKGNQILRSWHTRQPKRVERCESPNEKSIRRLLDAVI